MVVAANSWLIIDIGGRRAWNVVSTDVEVRVIVVVISFVHSPVFMVVVERQILVVRLHQQHWLSRFFAFTVSYGLVVTET